MSSFKVEHLLVSELDYELKIRGINIEDLPNVDTKRKVLRGALKQEEGNRSFTQISAGSIPFEEQQQGISVTLDDLAQKIGEFRGTVHDSQYGRLTSRLAHISGRVHLLSCIDEDQHSFKRSVSVRILTLEGELDSRVNPIASSTPNAPINIVPSFSYSKPVQVHKWGITFSGQTQHIDVISFLERVECLRISRGVSEDDLFAASAELFTDSAFTWFMNNRGRLSCWSDLVQKLKSDFLPYSFQDDLLDEIKSRKQKPGESVTMFINNILGMCSKLDTPLSDSAKIKIILKGLLPFYHAQLALVDIHNIEDLTDKCKRIEETLSWSSHPPTSSRPTSGPSSTPYQFSNRSWHQKSSNMSVLNSNLSCWNCHEAGHTFYECGKPRTHIFCHGCGRDNTLKRNCHKCSGNEQTEARTLSVPPSTIPSGSTTTVVEGNVGQAGSSNSRSGPLSEKSSTKHKRHNKSNQGKK
ncbi:uncharacterized protein [Diabrotica undecimpunctata]|uniref:uncharacterized protein n=1 Tax=Diabrotica undecimpunctata TaxID=50387 RepID=UPI003B6397ED